MRKTIILIAFVSVIGGCASITQGTTQTLIFNIDPSEARCTLTRTGEGELGSVTGKQNTIEVTKDKDDIIIRCNASGYKPKSQNLVSSVSGAGIASVVFIDLGIVDMITGAMYKYPTSVTISMEKL